MQMTEVLMTSKSTENCRLQIRQRPSGFQTSMSMRVTKPVKKK